MSPAHRPLPSARLRAEPIAQSMVQGYKLRLVRITVAVTFGHAGNLLRLRVRFISPPRLSTSLHRTQSIIIDTDPISQSRLSTPHRPPSTACSATRSRTWRRSRPWIRCRRSETEERPPCIHGRAGGRMQRVGGTLSDSRCFVHSLRGLPRGRLTATRRSHCVSASALLSILQSSHRIPSPSIAIRTSETGTSCGTKDLIQAFTRLTVVESPGSVYLHLLTS
ncbi:hypothetical protein BJ912DRAFT_993667 [Pholiota molesta]|nr:hypothetical protein BJ912DRAFT_993667 [Pholiota molesta]